MEKYPVSLEAIAAIAQAKSEADARLHETLVKKFERTFQDLLQREINLGQTAAAHFKQMVPSANSYTHVSSFPLPFYEVLTEETLLQLELSDIYLSKSEELKTANIRIIFHFE